MRVLVSGGAGFIGSHLSEQLLAAGHELAVIDNLNDYYALNLKEANLAEVRTRGSFLFRKGDICDRDTVEHLFREFRPEAVFHIAARAGVRPSVLDPFLYERVNVHGTLVMLEAARQASVKKFVFASSSSVYGVASKVPFTEDDPVQRPVSPYAATKIAAEKICYTYSHLHGLDTVCLRLFTVIGPRQRPDLAIRKFTSLMLRGEPIPMYGSGDSGRDYTYVGDIVAGMLAALEHQTRFDVFNLGNSQPVRLRDMIGTIERQLGVNANIDQLPDQPGDVPITYADISKARRVLGYQPATPFEEGIRKFVEWYRGCEAGR